MRAYFGHHKCGSTWVWELVQRVSGEIGLRHYLVVAERTASGRGPLSASVTGGLGRERAKGAFEREALRRRAGEAGANVVSCINADREQLEVLAPERGFHVIRDPRDIVVSGYFSHRNSHPVDGLPELAEHRERLLSVPKEEGLVLEMDFARRDLLDMLEWDYQRPEILEVRLEELTARPYDGFLRIFDHLGLLLDEESGTARELIGTSARRMLNRLAARRHLGAMRKPARASSEILLGAVYANRFEAKTKGRVAGAEDTRSHYRKGVARDWVNHFTPEHLDAFEDRFGDLAELLGYEFPALETVHG